MFENVHLLKLIWSVSKVCFAYDTYITIGIFCFAFIYVKLRPIFSLELIRLSAVHTISFLKPSSIICNVIRIGQHDGFSIQFHYVILFCICDYSF